MFRYLSNLIQRIKLYFGIGLPKRTLELHFGLSVTGRRKNKPELSGATLRKQYQQLDKRPKELFAKITAYLKALNRYKISPEKRLKLTQLCLDYAYPTSVKLQQYYQDNGGVPDVGERQELLDSAIEITQLCIYSLEIIYQHDYELPNWRYARVRDRFRLGAFRIIELIHFEQQLASLRYKNVAAKHWKDANQIYHIMVAYESVKAEQARLNQNPMEKLKKLDANKKQATIRYTTLHQLYLELQIYALMDHAEWPTKLQPIILQYLKTLEEPLSIVPDAKGVMPNNSVIIYYNANRPMLFKRSDRFEAPSSIINLSRLKQHIQKDLSIVLKQQAQDKEDTFHLNPLLRRVDPAHRLPILGLMSKKIRQDNWNQITRKHNEEADLRIYAGFEEVHQLLNDLLYPDDLNKSRREFKDIMSQRSAMLGEDETATQESKWHILDDNRQRLYLETQETRFTVPIHIGQLVAFGLGETGIKAPDIGFITRINRMQQRYVDVNITRIAPHAEPVEVELKYNYSQLDSKISGLLMLLKFGDEQQWNILLPYSKLYWEKSAIIIHRGNENYDVTIGKLKRLSPEFRMYSLTGFEADKLQALSYADAQQRLQDVEKKKQDAPVLM